MVLLWRKRWMSGTRIPCKSGYLRAKARLAATASLPSSTLARTRSAGPVPRPRNVEGASVTFGLLPMRFIFPVVSEEFSDYRSRERYYIVSNHQTILLAGL